VKPGAAKRRAELEVGLERLENPLERVQVLLVVRHKLFGGLRLWLADWLPAWAGTGIVFLPEAERAIAALAPPAPPLAVLIGPEGGFDARESAAAKAQGFHPLRLGPRVLRADTATAAAIAVVQSAWGDWR